MVSFTSFGRVFREHTGIGDVTVAEVRYACEFTVAQYHHGTLVAVIAPAEERELPSSSVYGKVLLDGKTADGNHVVAGNSGWSEFLRVGKDVDSGCSRIYATRLAWASVVYGQNADAEQCSLRFALANFQYAAERTLEFAIDSRTVVLIKAPDYDEAAARIRLTNTANVTCSAVIETQVDPDTFRFWANNWLPGADRLPAWEHYAIDRLTPLLSLARGTTVNWICADVTTGEESLVVTLYRNCNTEPSPLFLFDPSDDAATLGFVEKASGALDDAHGKWLTGHMIENYVAAKRQGKGETLNARGLLLCVIMEIVRAFYAHRTRASSRIPFAKSLSAMCRDVGLGLSEEDQHKFKDIRNSLVHTGQYLRENGDGWEQYTFLDRFVGRFLLASLGYCDEPPAWWTRPEWRKLR